MQGYQLTFYTLLDRRHGHQLLSEWLVEAANKLGVSGATMIPASEGFGHLHRIHSVHFIEMVDRPIEVTMALSAEEAESIFKLLRDEQINIFYVRTPIEYGMTGDKH